MNRTSRMRLNPFHRWLIASSLLLSTGLAWSGAAALPPQKTVEDFKRARTLLNEDPEAAWQIASKLPEIEHAEDVRLDLLSEAALRSQRSREALGHLEKLSGITEDSTEAYRADLERAELYFLLGDYEEADVVASDLRRRRHDVRGRSTDRRFLFSRLLRLRHDIAIAANGGEASKRAKGFAERLLKYYPAEEATKRPGLVLVPDDLSTSDRYRRARELMDAWSYHEAREEFERLRDHSKYGETARYNLGLIALRKLRDRPKEAEKIFKKLVKGGRYAEKSLWYVVRSQMRQERYDDALKTIDRYAKRYPRGRYTLSVYYYRGWLPYDHRQNDEAIEGLRAFIKKYGRRSYKSSYIYGFLSWAYMRKGEWKNAIDAWKEMLPFGNTLVAGKALYWMAYAHRELGETDEAIEALNRLREKYPISYYGMLGEQLRARIHGDDPRASKVWWPEGGGTLDDSPRVDVLGYDMDLSVSVEERWERVKTLAVLGEKHLAREELEPIDDDLLREVPREQHEEWIHALGRLVGDYNEMWDEATGGSISAMPGLPAPDELESAMAYPRAYRDIVEEVAGEFELPPALMWSIMRQESRYKPGAVSYTDAVGALQMIPKTARKVARDLGTVYNVRTFFRPEVGFRFSGYYMRKLLNTFEGLYVPMAASYNSGPKVVARWFRRNPEASFPWLIEEFEYNEGRAYCRKVAEHMLRYLYLYEEDDKRRGAILEQMFPLSRDIDLPDDVGY